MHRGPGALTQDALDGVMLDEFQVGDLDVGPRALHKRVSFALLLDYHLIRQPVTCQRKEGGGGKREQP